MSEFILDKIKFKTVTENRLSHESIEKTKDGEISEYTLRLKMAETASPKMYSIIWEQDQIDMLAFWSSKSCHDHHMTPDWWTRKEESRTASGMPLISIFNKKNENRVTVSLSDPLIPCTLQAGIVEENGTVMFKIDLFSKICAQMSEYELVIRIDERCVSLARAISDVRDWWSELGFKKAYVPRACTLPLYSTWYSFHQHTIPDEIVEQCAIAKELGMDTVIVDDGWQTDDNSRGYAYCGDWKVSSAKIPSMRDFVDRIHGLGMKFMIWFSVPYMGFESKNYERFKGMYLKKNSRLNAYVLDPRFKEVRNFLVDTYASYVREYGWDGLKLDFIDSFEETEESSKDYGKMDCISVEEGVRRLLDEVSAELKGINPEFMIEFRQSYIGPVVSQYGNMFRVTDCPNDALTNRLYSLGMRLTCAELPVHSDMIMWNEKDTPEAVCYQLLATMFCVPQISVKFDKITAQQHAILKNHLDFWREHQEILLNGELSISDMEANCSMARASLGNESVTVLYQNVVAEYDGGEAFIFNSTGADYIYIDSALDASYEITDMLGNAKNGGKIKVGVNKIPLENCARLKIT